MENVRVLSKGRIVKRWACGLALFSLLVILSSYYVIEHSAQGLVFEEVGKLPDNEVGLVLGTNKYLLGGGVNPYFKYRIEAASYLYAIGKVKYIIVSGDNSSPYYNEPAQMRKELIKMGVPSEAIYMDFAGFRTLDSVIRCKQVFGQESFTIISQEFHNKRALAISQEAGINAVAYNAQDVSLDRGFKVLIREAFARVRAMLDLYIFDTKPKYLGQKISIG